MKVILFGATGMVGQGALRECLLDDDVTEVLAVGRSAPSAAHAKLRALTPADLGDLTPNADELTGYDACFFCLGVSSVGTSEADYERITHDYAVAAGTVLAARNPGSVFVYVSGAGTDSTERGRVRWARVKGRTENALRALPLRTTVFRPGFIRALHGIRSRTGFYNAMYAVIRPFAGALQRAFPRQVTDTEAIGLAMLAAVRTDVADQVLDNAAINRLAGRARPSA